MRVIAGKARRLNLKTIEGMETRPTQDRTKETLFNMINNDIYNSNFLDLFSGSGSIGIEALSRGAKKCVMVENNKKAFDCIKDNLKYTRLLDDAVVMFMPVESALNDLKHKHELFDIVFMDPPYNHLFEKDVLKVLSDSQLIDINTIVIIEASNDTHFDYLDDYGYEMIKEKKYKTNKHVFVKKKVGE